MSKIMNIDTFHFDAKITAEKRFLEFKANMTKNEAREKARKDKIKRQKQEAGSELNSDLDSDDSQESVISRGDPFLKLQAKLH